MLEVKYGETALMRACDNGKVECVKLLLEHGADINAKDEDDCTALMIVCGAGQVECVKALLKHKGIDVNARDKDDYTALMCACNNGEVECAKFLLEHGADINAISKKGFTALRVACIKGEVECVKLLLEHKDIYVNAEDEDGFTALMRLIQELRVVCEEALVNCKNAQKPKEQKIEKLSEEKLKIDNPTDEGGLGR